MNIAQPGAFSAVRRLARRLCLRRRCTGDAMRWLASPSYPGSNATPTGLTIKDADDLEAVLTFVRAWVGPSDANAVFNSGRCTMDLDRLASKSVLPSCRAQRPWFARCIEPRNGGARSGLSEPHPRQFSQLRQPSHGIGRGPGTHPRPGHGTRHSSPSSGLLLPCVTFHVRDECGALRRDSAALPTMCQLGPELSNDANALDANSQLVEGTCVRAGIDLLTNTQAMNRTSS